MHGRGLKLFRSYKHLAREFYSGRVFAAIDTETTGQHSATDHLIEIGGIQFGMEGTVGSPFSSLIKPPVPLTPFVQNLTHITQEMLCGQKDANAVLPEFLRWLSGSNAILIAHNAPFDMYFINNQLAKMNLPPLANTVIDTLPLSRWAYPGLNKNGLSGQYRLQNLAALLKIPVREAHRALDDARVCMELFKRILKDTASVQKDLAPQPQSKEPPLAPQSPQLELF